MAKDYILRSIPTESGPPSFVQRAMTWAKATNEITGLIRGILADGIVTESKAKYLREWINSRPTLLDDSLVRALSDRIERIFEDGIVTPEELEELKIVLEQFTPEGENPTTLRRLKLLFQTRHFASPALLSVAPAHGAKTRS